MVITPDSLQMFYNNPREVRREIELNLEKLSVFLTD